MRRVLLALVAALCIAPAAHAEQQYDPGGKARVSLYCKSAIAGDTACPVLTGSANIPSGATQVTDSSGNVANASAAATLAATSGKTTYIKGFVCTPGGSTGAALATVTVTHTSNAGVAKTLSFTLGTPAGATLMGTPLIVTFGDGLAADAANTAIVVTMPALGAGNTNASCSAWGYQL